MRTKFNYYYFAIFGNKQQCKYERCIIITFNRYAHSASPRLEDWGLGGLEDWRLRGAKRGEDGNILNDLYLARPAPLTSKGRRI